jgi:dienelactone hydrolase
MRHEVPGLANAVGGISANGVPFVALRPEEAPGRAVVIAWHGGDPPRKEEALAAAVPMRALPAWRIYLGMPLYGQRKPAGGFEEIMRRGTEDAVTLIFHPSIGGAVAELPEALADIRRQLGIDAGLPVGLFGFSQGGAAALVQTSRGNLPIKAVATFGAVVDMASLVDGLAGFFGITYEWTDARRALAEELSTSSKAAQLAASGAPILLAVGDQDPYPMREPIAQLAAAIKQAGGTAEERIVPGVPHRLTDEPGEEPAEQSAAARAVDEIVTDWFRRHLIPA